MNSRSQESLARSAMYELLSAAFLYPEEGSAELIKNGSGQMTGVCLEVGWNNLVDPLRELEQQLASIADGGLDGEYVSVFGHTISTDCPAYETEYDKAHVFQKSQTLADLGTFYQAFGVSQNPQVKERLDHISVELEFMNLLSLKEAYAYAKGHGEDKARLCRDAQQNFLATHLAEWINSFVYRLSQRTGGLGIYGSLGCLLEQYMAAEFERFQLDPDPADFHEPAEAVEDELDCAACPLEEDMPLPQRTVFPLRVMSKQ